MKILDGMPQADETRNILSIIGGFEAEAVEILKNAGFPSNIKSSAGGLPPCIREILESRCDSAGMPFKKRPLPARIFDVISMLQFFWMVRFFIEEKDTNRALCFMAYGMQAAMKARLRPVEPKVDIGVHRSEQQKKTRAKRNTWHGMSKEEIQKRDESIRADYAKSKLTVNAFAIRHAARKTYLKGSGKHLTAPAIRKVLSPTS